jgi:hypothetical protein
MSQKLPEGFREPFELSEHKELSYSIISIGDLISIDLTGGEYRGFVKSETGLQFYDFWTERKSYFSNAHNRVLQMKIESNNTDQSDKQYYSMPYRIEFSGESLTNELIFDIKFLIRFKTDISEPPPQFELRNFTQQIHESFCRLLEKNKADVSPAKIRAAINGHVNPYCTVEELQSH